MSSSSLIYTTWPDSPSAEATSRILLDKNLIACANIYPPVKSIFKWQGKVDHSDEIVMILKTQKQHFQKVEEIITSQHPYDVPCIVLIPIENGHAPFLNWIQEQTQN